MNKTYLPEYYCFESHGMANPEAVVKGDQYRFTVLTPSFIRMEYSANGYFEDRPTQIIWHRKQPVPSYTVTHTETHLTIRTDKLVLTYEKEAHFSRSSLMIKAVTEAIHGSGVYRHGFHAKDNLGGTSRTLDGVDGRIDLEDGLFSEEGYTIIDDKGSLVFTEDGWFEKRPEGTVDLYYFGYGRDFKEGLKAYYQVTGKTPLLPRYALGNWWSRYWAYSDHELKGLLDDFQERQIPLSVCIIDMDWHKVDISKEYGSGWTGYSWNRDLFAEPKAFVASLHTRGIRTALNLHPALGIRGHEDCYKPFAEFMGMDPETEEMIPFDPIDPRFMKGYFDYAHHPHEEMGVDFWWIDWQQGNNTAVEGIDPLYLLNHYHFMDHGRDLARRPFTFSRWSGLGSHRYPIGFSGDTVVTWDSLKFQPEFTALAANVGYGWWSHDIGGHYNGIEDDELYTRWVQLGVFSPIMRLHTSKNYYGKREPWRHSMEAEAITRDYLQLRHELIPYIYSMNKLHSEGGLPLITPMYYHTGFTWDTKKILDQYMFGSELLVAPFLEPMDSKLCAAKRKVFLPEGLWFDWMTGEVFQGNRNVLIYGDLGDTPIFAKAGGIIPRGQLPLGDEGNLLPDIDTLPKDLVIDIFPGADHHFELYEDDGVSNHYKEGQWVKTVYEVTYETKDECQLMHLKKSIQGDTSLIPLNRRTTFAFRAFKEPEDILVEGGCIIQEDLTTKSLMIEAMNETNEWAMTLKLPLQYIDQDYDPTQDIMEKMENGRYLSADKGAIGFVMDEDHLVKGGILGNDMSPLEKIGQVSALDMPSELKEMVISYLARTK